MGDEQRDEQIVEIGGYRKGWWRPGERTPRRWPVVSVHIPKTAGTSFLHVLRGWYGDELSLEYHCNRKVAPVDGPGTVRHGHFAASEYEADLLVTWMRDPVARVASHFHYLREKPDHPGPDEMRELMRAHPDMGLLEFAELPRMRNLQAWYIDGVALDRFDVVGIVEHTAAELVRLGLLLGRPAPALPARRNATASPAYAAWKRSPGRARDEARIRALNELDQELYDEAVARMHQQWRELATRTVAVDAARLHLGEQPRGADRGAAAGAYELAVVEPPASVPGDCREALDAWFPGLVARPPGSAGPAGHPWKRVAVAVDPESARAVAERGADRTVAWVRDPALRALELWHRWSGEEPEAGSCEAHRLVHAGELDLDGLAAHPDVADAQAQLLEVAGIAPDAGTDLVLDGDDPHGELLRLAGTLGLPPLEGPAPDAPASAAHERDLMRPGRDELLARLRRHSPRDTALWRGSQAARERFWTRFEADADVAA